MCQSGIMYGIFFLMNETTTITTTKNYPPITAFTITNAHKIYSCIKCMRTELLAQYHHPDIRAYSRKKDMEQGLAKAEKMERYLQRIKEIAPSSEWNKLGALAPCVEMRLDRIVSNVP